MDTEILRGVWPDWEIVRLLGKGSFGAVYEAVRKDDLLESRAAVKVISIPRDSAEMSSLRSEGMSVAESKTYLASIARDLAGEIQLMESFKGTQNIVSIEDYKVVAKPDGIGWNIYIRMELLTPFNDYLGDRVLPEADVIRLGVDICTALELCAQRKVIHRDIKPENIFVNPFGSFKLGDFGIARKLENVTSALSRKGTYNYMAPEIARGISYDASVDLYSLGLVLYRLMNGNRLPFLEETNARTIGPRDRTEALRRRLSGEALPPPCNASPDMARVILCACDPDPSKRFASPTAMKNALLGIDTGPAASDDPGDRTWRLDETVRQGDGEIPDAVLSGTVRLPPEAEAAAQESRAEPESSSPPPATDPPEDVGEAISPEPPVRKRSRVPVILAISLAVLLLALAGLFLFFRHQRGPSDDPSALPTAEAADKLTAAPEKTAAPTPTPTSAPTATPEPTAAPTDEPEPTAAPTEEPEPAAAPADESGISALTLVTPAPIVPVLPETFIPWEDAGRTDHPMAWNDTVLENAMRAVTGIEDGDILLSDVWGITSLNLPGYESLSIQNIEALSELENLTHIALSFNGIRDLRPLARLPHLQYLDLSYNAIRDLTPLSGLTSLTELYLDGNGISDITPLKDLTNLKVLWAGENDILDASPLSGLTGLQQLGLPSNQIRDVTPLYPLTGLDDLYLSDNAISDADMAALREALPDTVIS